MNQESLDGKLAMVTGAAGVLGLAVCKTLAEDGISVIMADLDGKGVEERSKEIKGEAIPLTLDVSNPDKVAVACASIRGEYGPVDILINNAGILSNNKAAETTPEEWRNLMSINLDGAFYQAREWLPGMKEKGWGRIVNICSLAQKTGGLTAGTAYTTSKGGISVIRLITP